MSAWRQILAWEVDPEVALIFPKHGSRYIFHFDFKAGTYWVTYPPGDRGPVNADTPWYFRRDGPNTWFYGSHPYEISAAFPSWDIKVLERAYKDYMRI